MDYKIPMFSLFTRFAYRWNVKSNRYLIVQQEWMRNAMACLVGLDASGIIVAPPAFKPVAIPEIDSRSEPGMMTFLYPSTADAHKDFETLCEAARLLEGRIGEGRFRVVITVKGDENRYAHWLKRRWSDVKSLDFRGFLSREGLALEYRSASCLVFPSRAESWGLPISEFLPTGKPMILADLPYAHETAAGAKEVAFFPVSDAGALADLMQAAAEGRNDIFRSVPQPDIKPPYARSWEALFNLLLS
jgi:glycosyltransferase involved in cell wall biosynthesis